MNRQPEIVEALDRFREGRPDEAEAACRRILAERPDDADANHLMGLIAERAGDPGAALERIGKAVAAAPANPAYRYNLANLLRDCGRTDQAVESYRRALGLEPGLTRAAGNLAALLEEANRLDESQAAADAGLAADPADPLLNLTAAKLDRRRGRHREALDRLSGIQRSGLDPAFGMGIDFELGRLHDLDGDPGKAFARFAGANALQARLSVADKDRYLAEIGVLSRCFTEDWVGSWTPPPPAGDDTPAFLVGFPRSGTTLLERIIDAHPATLTLSEKPAVEAVKRAVAARPEGHPRALAGLSAARIRRLGRIYDRAAAKYVHRQPGRLLVDKLPLNIVEAGLIARIFPGARLVLAVRHPCDVCLSCFMQPFEVNDAMASFFSLEDAARLYVRVMGLWRQYERVLGLDVHTVRYEDLIDDFRAETGRLLEFLGLGWDDAVLDFAEGARRAGRIATPSYHQVGEPLYRRARYRWRRYARFLEPVIEDLKPFIEGFGYS